ncbi:hypothetical protein [Chromobacterium sphagni]|uniref:Chemotaxis phosphatase CheX-like domain-containing protein n=1 Tax=Chromobacterium sphagni TaxID=1903179 RepID=A0ABX3C8A2_9NEIS|nr:hypothetical protein [Chromobacterium sphagni]OHX17009.1 hypothetical protein BI344_12140 [Chromobacterium sphagni]
MISAAAAESLDLICRQALLDSCGACMVHALGQAMPKADPAANELILLNISSYHFRFAMLFHFDDSPALRAQLASWTRSHAPLDRHALRDAHGEMANLISGAVNRSLCVPFRHVGMSTPLGLGGGCLRHIDMLGAALRRGYEVEMAEGARFWMTTCLYLSTGASLDFRYRPPMLVEESAGELELF